MAEPRGAPFGHESPSVATRKVVGVVLTLGAIAAIALVALWLALAYWVMPRHAQLKTQPATLPPAPRLQPDPDHDLTAFRKEKRALLDGYAWTDKSHRFARIPIGRAMRIYVQEQQHGAGSRDRGSVGKGQRARSAFARKSGPAPGDREPDANTRVPGAGNRGHAADTPAAASSAGRHP